LPFNTAQPKLKARFSGDPLGARLAGRDVQRVGWAGGLLSPTTEVVMSTTVETATAVRPFRIEVAEEELADLRRRVQSTRWPEKETVGDASQGVQLATMQALVRYWGSDYDLR